MPAGWRDRLERILERQRVRMVRDVLARYERAGDGLIAGGLAYSALFAMVPLVIVAAGLTGLLVQEPAVRARVIATIADVLPPLRGLVSLVLTESAVSAGTISILGAASLLWGGSRFVLAFESAMDRVSDERQQRNVVERNIASLGAAVVLAGAVVFSAVVAAMADFLDAATRADAGVVLSFATRLVLAVLPVAVVVAAAALVYRFVFPVRPSWSASWRPAWVVGIVLTIFARLFVFIAPRLIGAAATIGALATLFAGLAWLSLSFQAILVGAAWVRERQDRLEQVLADEATLEAPAE